ncbi:MAG: efflux RND transporter permease subunit [Pseudomonadales bacterium]|nr:efflux RND transporter permease subunit [Pseudomonadales bacterium]
MIAWFARNHVAANLLMLAIIFAGGLSLVQRTTLEVFPEIALDLISVSMSLRGATPEEVEQGLSVRIEEAVQDLEGIESIYSRSTEGSSYVRIDVEAGYDPRELLNDIKSRVDAVNNFPVDAEKPVVTLDAHKNEVITAVIAAPISEKEIRILAEKVRDDLLRIPGVTQVALDGVRPYEVAIEVPSHRLKELDLSLAEVASAIQKSSLDASAGNVKTEGGEVLLRTKGQAYHKQEFNDVVVLTQNDGSILRVRDIAAVKDGFEETPVSTFFNGKRAAFIDVSRVGDQSAIEVADKVKAYLEKQQDKFPDNVELTYWRDRSMVVKKRLNTLANNALQGGVLVLLLLTLFLRPAIAFWVFIGVPISFMGAFILLPMMGFTLNLISLFGFILVLGIVVDDAIVTGENVYTHLRDAESGIDAAIRGTEEVAVPVTFGILTTVVAFLPLAFVEGVRGQLFANIPAVVIPVLIFSLIESKFVLPSHLKHIRLPAQINNGSKLEQWQQRFANGFEQFILKYYQPMLKWSLINRYLCLSFFIAAIMIIGAMLSSGWINFTFFPRIQSEIARASLTMPIGTPFEVTEKHVQRISDAAFALKKKYQEKHNEEVILHIKSITGSSSGSSSASHQGRVMFEIVAPEDRLSEVTSAQLVREWRKEIGVIPGAELLTFRAEIGRGGDPIDVQLSGHNLATLSEVAEKVKAKLAAYPTVYDISDSLSDGKEELQIRLLDEAYALGLSRSDVISQIRQAFYGYEVQRVQRGRDDVRVMVRYPLEERSSVTSLLDLDVRTNDGKVIPLSQIAELVPGKSPATIYRSDRYRTVDVTADVNKEKTNMTVLMADLEQAIQQIQQQYPGIDYSFEGEVKEQRESMGSLLLGLIFILFAIYCLLAIPFKSYLQPIIVMSIIPFGPIGALIGHWIMGMNLTVMSVMGMLALVGVVVNDSLVLVDFINKRKDRGADSLIDTISTAGAARFRPVMLTSLTTFIGLMPLLFEKSTQAQFLIPMAVSLAFGIIFATLLTLILVPINYLMIEDLRRFFYGDKATASQA